MPKRKRREWQQQPGELVSSEDEIRVATRVASTKRFNAHHSESGTDYLGDRFRARAGTTVVNDGFVTPLTLGGASESTKQEQGSESTKEARELPAAPINAKVLVPDCRDGSAYPRSIYQGFEPPLKEVSERVAISLLVAAHKDAHLDDEEYTYIALDQFSIYRPETSIYHANELVTLDRLSRDSYPEFCFDGILSVGSHKYFVRNVRFAILAVDGYGEPDVTDMRDQLCVQSSHAKKHDAWLRLGTPAREYQRFYQPFLWLVKFTKHFVDYLLCTKQVTIAHFREKFLTWLQEMYGDKDSSLQIWLREANLRDFRTTVAAHVELLWKECCGTQQPSDEIQICTQPIWAEVHPARLDAIPEQENLAKRTVVTPFAYDCFKSMYFADQFVESPITDTKVQGTVRQLKAKLGLTPLYEPRAFTPISNTSEPPEARVPASLASKAADSAETINIKVGDVVMLPPEKEGSWRSVADCWYAYVQRIHTKDGKTRLDILWLYHASDTTIGNVYYPFQNELFFSDNCGCDTKEHQESWDLGEVIRKVDVAWFTKDPYQANEKGLFVRQKFRTVPEMDHFDFVTLQETDFRCHHQPDHVETEEEAYAIGDVVLVRNPLLTLCEVAQVVGGGRRRLKLRRLHVRRRRESQPAARANELVATSEVFEATLENDKGNDSDNDDPMDEDDAIGQVVRKCHVQTFTREEIDGGNLPAPYDRNGTGDFFIMEASETENDSFPSINKGWDPRTPSGFKKLTGLGIFCGGGTFDRGLEEGGAVKFQYAVDWTEHALHSYRANLDQPQEVDFFLGSVNDYLAKALSGDLSVAAPGSVQLISAGSPCQGFSRMQINTASEQSKQNASMVASVVAFADLYCPQYMILENVVSMTEGRNERKEHNVFQQILAALVALGYQIQQFLGDSWSHGSCQQRSRLFIIATAPGLTPPPQPPCSHAHPPDISTRSLGRSSNGLPFGSRKVNPDVALPHISPQEAVGDLPPVYDSQPQLCPAFPDHRAATNETSRSRLLMRAVPIRPRGMTLVQAWEQGRLSGEPLRFCESSGQLRQATTSKMYARVLPDKLFPTIVTRLAVADGMNGRCLHWDEHRVLTVMEAKRAQGYLDHEVLVGSATQQVKIVGNSVDRSAALVLGLSLRKSWLKSHSSIPTDSNDVDMMVDVDLTDDEMLQERNGTGFSNVEVDNRTVKMSLTMSREEIEGVDKVTASTGSTFKKLLRVLSSSKEHQIARESIHGAAG